MKGRGACRQLYGHHRADLDLGTGGTFRLSQGRGATAGIHLLVGRSYREQMVCNTTREVSLNRQAKGAARPPVRMYDAFGIFGTNLPETIGVFHQSSSVHQQKWPADISKRIADLWT